MENGSSTQQRLNDQTYRNPSAARAYEFERRLRPAESLLLLRHRDRLTKSVVELGCGTGRVTRHLLELSHDLLGLDISPTMVDACRSTMPAGTYEVADIRDLARVVPSPVDAIVASFNVIDVFDHDQRAHMLVTIREALAPGGFLLLSSHNLAAAGDIRGPGHILSSRPRTLVGNVVRFPQRMRNHRRLAPLERDGTGYAIRNDLAHEYGLLHYYVSPGQQVSQFEQAGLQFVECVDLSGEHVDPADARTTSPELYYAAVRA